MRKLYNLFVNFTDCLDKHVITGSRWIFQPPIKSFITGKKWAFDITAHRNSDIYGRNICQ